jgi:hypothetical protein
MVILPRSSAPDGLPRAQKLLHDAADQRVHCTLVVFGDSDRAREIASRADLRSQNNPFRGVIWAPDVAVLQGDDAFKPLLAELSKGEEAVALTLKFEVSGSLHGDAALDWYEIEQALARAGAGLVKP